MYALAIEINAAPPRTRITAVWDTNLPHYEDLYQDERHLVAFSCAPFSPDEYGSFTAWRTDTRPWVGTTDMCFEVPGMVFFARTGEYGMGDGTNYACKHRMGKWFRQVIPAGSQIDLLQQESRRFRTRHGLETEQIIDWRITLSSTGFHFDPIASSDSRWKAYEEFVKPEGFTPLFQHKGIQDILRTDENSVGEEPAPCLPLFAQAQAPDAAADAAGQAAPLRRVPGFTEPLNDLAPVARSSPRRAASVPPPLMAGNHVSFFGKIFRQIIPLSIIRYTPMSGTPSFIQAPGDHTAGVPGLQTRAAPKCFARAEENALGASLNAQSQAQDIPGGSSSADFSRHTLSFRAHSKAPDKISLRAYSEQLLGSLNAQSQAPDDPLSLRAYIGLLWASFHAQDHQCDPHIFVDYNRFCRQEPARLLTTQDSLYFSLQQVLPPFDTLLLPPLSSLCKVYMRSQEMPQSGDSVVRQGVVCFHSGGLGFSWTFTAVVFNDPCGSSLRDPYIFVDYFRLCRQEPARSLMTQDKLYFSFQQALPPSDTLLLPPLSSLCKVYMRSQEMPQSGDSVVRQGVVCFLSGGLVFSWICTAIVFYDPCGSSLFVSMYISLAFSLRRFA